MHTGIITLSEKYITKEMIQYAYNQLDSAKIFTSKGLADNFPHEYSQGACVYSMTGGILELLGIAEYKKRKGYTKRRN
ncbi:MAG TPA: hypothetical protein VFF28_02565 [Candidatus Nanoarchaeia archaeon]|nr:hypothetical protein [Candidatus Nanoarchaeia archaeon]